MILDLATAQIALNTVGITAGVVFILDTLLRRPDAAGRMWAVAFMAGILASIANEIWVALPDAWWAIVVADSGIVMTIGLLWSGARAFNGRRDLVWVPALGAAATAIAVLAAGPAGGAWAGGAVLLGLVVVFAGFGAFETLRAPMRESWAARGLTAVFGVVAVFTAARLVVFAMGGPDDPWFTTYFSSEATALVFIALIVLAVSCLLILQAERLPRTGARGTFASFFTAEGVLTDAAFRVVAGDRLERAGFHDEQLVVARVRLDELDAITTAFGRSAADEIVARFIVGVRRYSPADASIGARVPGELVVVAEFARLEEARRAGEAIQAGLRDRPIDHAQGLRMSASIGLAGTDEHGYDLVRLLAAAGRAVERARASGGDAIEVASAE